MQSTPLASRKQVAIFGNTNAGKSTLFNLIMGQNTAIVSEEKGTTTDPVIKAMELIPFGPIALIDTAGLDDDSILGSKRREKTTAVLHRADFAVYVVDGSSLDMSGYEEMKEEFLKREIPHLLVFSKASSMTENTKENYRKKYPRAVFTEKEDENSIQGLKERLIKELDSLEESEDTILGNLLPAHSNLILVAPIDSEAPKGRLILPQVQLIRDALDHGMKCFVTRDEELPEALLSLHPVDLVVTDSQAFQKVSAIVPRKIPLTSFSILFARQKGDLSVYLKGIDAVKNLRDGSKILLAEACSHNVSHEDIGRVKIPKGLHRYTEKELSFDYAVGYEFPEGNDLKQYDLVIHCGGCMVNRKTVRSRIALCEEAGVPITNYGLILALFSGILDRAVEGVR